MKHIALNVIRVYFPVQLNVVAAIDVITDLAFRMLTIASIPSGLRFFVKGKNKERYRFLKLNEASC